MPRLSRAGAQKAIALLALLGAAGAVSGSLGTSTLAGPQGQTGDSAALEALLRAAVPEPGRQAEVGPLAQALVASARREGLDPGPALALAFPRPDSILSMLALDRDVDDFAEAGEGEGAAAAHYRRAAEAARVYRPLRANFTQLFAESWKAQTGLPAPGKDVQRIYLRDLAPQGSLESPNLGELAYSHPYALDIFFSRVQRRGKEEFGPPISALEEGLVVAASGNWRGGEGAAAWKGGGLSPSAGNGVVIYAPLSGRYYSYFHFSEVAVQAGDRVWRGTVLGRGGNSGANARKTDHGRHLHLEIFDSRTDQALSAWEIRRLLF